MKLELKLPVWLLKELERDAQGKSYQTIIKEILKEKYKGVDRREEEGEA